MSQWYVSTYAYDDPDGRRTAAPGQGTRGRTGTTLTRLIEDAVRQLLSRRRVSKVREPVCLPTFSGEGVQPGVDLDDTAALVELMDERNASG